MLVFLEGLPGCGKSTRAQFLALSFQQDGRRAQWFHEGQLDHPTRVDLPTAPALDIRDYRDRSLQKWICLCQNWSDSALILDGALFHVAARMLLSHLMPMPEIASFARTVRQAVGPMDPALIYFRPKNGYEAFYERLCEERGPAWSAYVDQSTLAWPWSQERGYAGREGVLAYWADFSDLLEEMVPVFGCRTLEVDPWSEGWDACNRRVCSFLGVAPATHKGQPRSALEAYVGVYAARDHEMAIELPDSGLCLRDFHWLRTRMLLKDWGAFYLQGWPQELVFENDASGKMVMRIAGPRCKWGRQPGEVYIRKG